MDDLISRKALIDFLLNVPFLRGHELLKALVIDWVNQQPTVEAVPVVRCKNCEHWGTGVCGETDYAKCCEYGKYMVGKNGYCCYADMRKKVQE